MAIDHDEDPLELLADGLITYLHDLEDARQHCIRHAPTTEIARGRDGILRLTKRYRVAGDVASHVRLRLRRKSNVVPGSLLTEGWVSWEGWPLHLKIRSGANSLTVTVGGLSDADGIPTQPLFHVTHLLRCHEMLVAGLPHEPIQVSRLKTRWPLQAYLLRAMTPFGGPSQSEFVTWPLPTANT